MKISSKEIIVLVALGILLIIASNFNQNQDSTPVDEDDRVLKNSDFWVESPIYIDGSATGVGAHNWTWALDQEWCNFVNGFYVIENVTINGDNLGSCIFIRDSNVPFIIRNCTCFNAGGIDDHPGILLDNVSKGQLIGNNCSHNNQDGMGITNCNNITIVNNTANNNGPYGIATHETKNCTILTNVAMYNDDKGINLSHTNTTVVKKNILNENLNDGIKLYKCHNNTVIGNWAEYNGKY